MTDIYRKWLDRLDGVWSYTWTPWTQHAYERQPRPVLSWRAEAPELIGVNR